MWTHPHRSTGGTGMQNGAEKIEQPSKASPRVETSCLPALGMISMSGFVLVLNISMNIRNGQRLSIDDLGWFANGALIGALSLAPTAAMAFSGYYWRRGRYILSSLAALVAVPLVGFNLWNAYEFVGDQMLGKHDRATIDQELANKSNEEILRSKREAEERLWQAWRATRDLPEKSILLRQIEKVRSEIPTLKATIEAPSAIGARATWLAKQFGWDKGAIDGITPMLLPVFMQLVELSFSFFGFSARPRRREKARPTEPPLDSAEFRAEFSMDEAR